jgi:hypothetical protein
MNLASKNFSDNKQKKNARDFLVSIVNSHFKRSEPKALTMLELLGTGVGTDHYVQNINNLGSIDAIEIDRKQFEQYTKTDDRINVYNTNLEKFVSSKHAQNYDILNLDFCSFFCEETMVTRLSTGALLKKVLLSKKYNVGSLFFVTFLLEGFQIRISQYEDSILSDPDTVIKRIIEIGSECGIQISSTDATFIYKPSVRGWNKMMHTGFVVNAM